MAEVKEVLTVGPSPSTLRVLTSPAQRERCDLNYITLPASQLDFIEK